MIRLEENIGGRWMASASETEAGNIRLRVVRPDGSVATDMTFVPEAIPIVCRLLLRCASLIKAKDVT